MSVIDLSRGTLTETFPIYSSKENTDGQSRVLYLPQLDGLRAFAVGAVLVHHFLPIGRFVPTDFLTLGDLGVRLFFVLSGFLISGILLSCRREVEEGGVSQMYTLRQFYARRFLRIFPVYYLTLAVAFTLNLESVRETILWHLTYLSNVYFSIKGAWAGPVSHFWSLAVEEQFYLIWPWLLILLPRRYLLGTLVCAIAAGPVFRLLIYGATGNELASYILLFGCLDSLALGALLAYYDSKPELDQKKRAFVRFAAITGALLLSVQLVLWFAGAVKWLNVSFTHLAVSFLFVWLIDRAASASTGVAGRVLEFGPIVYLGRISYGIYLFHPLVPDCLKKLFSVIQVPYPAGPGSTIPLFVLLVTTTVFAASISWFFFEGPINKLKRLFPYHRSHRVIRDEPGQVAVSVGLP